MASVVVTLKVMPTGPEENLQKIYDESCKKISAFVDEKHKNDEKRKEIEEIGFGLKALKITFVMDEQLGTTDKLEQEMAKIKGVQSVEATDVRRAIG